MSIPVEFQRFYDNGKNKRELENFQNYLFENIDLRNKDLPISFYRSDFRSTKLINTHFENNNFDRADFVDSYLENTTFTNCNFGTDFINTYFRNVKFEANKVDTCTFNECIFDNCHFENEIIKNTGYRKCEYINCQITNCIYEMNTLDGLSFINTKFHNINYANSSCHNFDFTNCNFIKMIFNPDYLGSYLFKNTDLNSLTFSYKGQELNLSDNIKESIELIRSFYASNKRYAELFNLNIILNSLDKDQDVDFLKKMFEGVLSGILYDEHIPRKRNNFENIFRILQFYADTSLISVDSYFYIIGLLEHLEIQNFDFKTQLAYNSGLLVTKDIFEHEVFERKNILRISDTSPIYLEIQIDEEDYEITQELLNNIFLEIKQRYYLQDKNEEFLSIIGTHKGSLYIEIMGWTGAVVTLIYGIKSIANNSFKIYIQYSFTKKITHLLKKQKKIDDVYKSAQTINTIIKDDSSGPAQKDLRNLSKLVKSIKVFPNTLKD